MVTASDPIDPAGRDLVWHYTDAAGLLGIVRGHSLWATASAFLNDREEIALGVRLVGDIIRERARDGDPVAGRLSQRLDVSRDGTPSPTLFFILSAARHHDLLAMWRLYGGLGESYAVGLDPSAQLAVLADADHAPSGGDGEPQRGVKLRPWSPVRYAEAEQRSLAEAVLEGLPEEVASLRARVRTTGTPTRDDVLEHFAETIDDVEQAMFLIKHSGFADEREIRYCATVVADGGDPYWGGVVQFRSSRYGLAPYLRLTGGDGEPIVTTPAPLPIRALAISPTPNGDRAAESASALLRAHGYDVPVTRSTIPFRG